MKNLVLSSEIEYVKNRLKVQKFICGWWFFDGKFQRKLTTEENDAYYHLKTL